MLVSSLKLKLRTYFSGKLAMIQIAAGVAAFLGRTLAAYLTQDQSTWTIVGVSQFGGFMGYISIYVVGYLLAFRQDYIGSERSMALDILRLELVEQFPSLVGLVPAALTQAALIEAGGIDPIVSVNLGSWFGPQKIINLLAMVSSNSLKKSWVDHTWSPVVAGRTLFRRLPILKARQREPMEDIQVDVIGAEAPNLPAE